MMKVLVLSAHPDDETLGCGGTLLKHHSNGDQLHWMIATQAYTPQWSEATIRQKAVEVERVAKAYRMRSVTKLGFPTVRLDCVPHIDLINEIRSVIAKVRPSIVYLVHEGDIHTDHRMLFSATMSVLKPFYMGQLGVKRVLSFETLSSSDAAPALSSRVFLPTVFNDVSRYLESKIRIMKLFKSEIQPTLWPRTADTIRSLARVRGATVGCQYAEAFQLIREVVL